MQICKCVQAEQGTLPKDLLHSGSNGHPQIILLFQFQAETEKRTLWSLVPSKTIARSSGLWVSRQGIRYSLQ